MDSSTTKRAAINCTSEKRAATNGTNEEPASKRQAQGRPEAQDKMNKEEEEDDNKESNLSALGKVAGRVASLVRESKAREVHGISSELHPLPPFVIREEWTKLGDAIKKAEQPAGVTVPGDKWISLRCDGTGFSKLTKRLKKEGIFDSGYSEDFATMMVSCCRALMGKFQNTKCGYTQSDEITVLLPPATVVRGVQQDHMYSGRIQKICSLAAAAVTATFNTELMLLCGKKKKLEDGLALLQQCAPTFDCRVGTYNTQEEALSLILWRAYDCGVNAVSDAVFKCGIPGAKKAVRLTTDQKLVWLKQHQLLPLQPHQREGTFLLKRKRMLEGINQKTGQPTTYYRGRVEQVHGCVLQLFKEGALMLPDEEEPNS